MSIQVFSGPMAQVNCRAAGGTYAGPTNSVYNPATADQINCYFAPVQQQAPAPAQVTVSPVISSQISPTISPVFQQQFQPSNSPQSASTQAAPVMGPAAPAPAYVPPAPTASPPVYTGPIGPQPVENLAPAIPEYVPPQPTALVLNPSSGGGGGTVPASTNTSTATASAPAQTNWGLYVILGLGAIMLMGNKNAA